VVEGANLDAVAAEEDRGDDFTRGMTRGERPARLERRYTRAQTAPERVERLPDQGRDPPLQSLRAGLKCHRQAL
jgi:hypothetical protein